ncbi:hypothetical protein HHK36_010046 [Tetracentron sinense]|uniref:Plastid division protein PDV2 n=1 Tax=Tetracentron sinense TaxID=13715 RepID=A0A835DIR8_TETSI|nr:hypothetical protein HHK36_010046 [Tetracentron sinense]
MEEDEIGIVLSRASELRSKINNCIDKATKPDRDEGDDPSRSLDEADIEAESLLNIRDAFDSLEEQLASLQALQQQQQYERQVTLAEIDHSRKILLNKLKEYKGEDLEVLHEASAFASETVEHSNDLLLPPYPSRSPQPLVLGNGYPSHFPFTRKFARNGVIGGGPLTESNNCPSESERNRIQHRTRNSATGVRFVINAAAKTVLTIVSVISVLCLAGYEPRLRKRDTQFKGVDLFQKPAIEENRAAPQCPPGKVLVMENGEPRCLVKERVEIPFQSVVTMPDVSFGCG